MEPQFRNPAYICMYVRKDDLAVKTVQFDHFEQRTEVGYRLVLTAQLKMLKQNQKKLDVRQGWLYKLILWTYEIFISKKRYLPSY